MSLVYLWHQLMQNIVGFDIFSIRFYLMWLDSTFLTHTHFKKVYQNSISIKKLLNEKPGEIASHKITPTS